MLIVDQELWEPVEDLLKWREVVVEALMRARYHRRPLLMKEVAGVLDGALCVVLFPLRDDGIAHAGRQGSHALGAKRLP